SITSVDTVDVHTSTTVADSIVENTHISTSKTSVETSADLYESTTYVGALKESLLADEILESYNFGTRTLNTFGGVDVGLSFVGFHHHRRKGTAIACTLAGTTIDISVAATASLSIGLFNAVSFTNKFGLGKTLIKASLTLIDLKLSLLRNNIYVLNATNRGSNFEQAINDQTFCMSEIHF